MDENLVQQPRAAEAEAASVDVAQPAAIQQRDANPQTLAAFRSRQEGVLTVFMMSLFLAGALLVAWSALEVLFDYVLLAPWTPSHGRAVVFRIAQTEFSPKLTGAVSGLVALGLGIVARPSKKSKRWCILTYGSMASAAICALMILAYEGDESGAILDIPNIGIGQSLSDSEVPVLGGSIQAFYSAMAVWFLGLLLPLVLAPDRQPAQGGKP